MSWVNVRLGDLFRLVNGNAYKPTDWSSAGVPIIRIQNLNDPSKPFNYWAGPTDHRVNVKHGDLLLGWSGTPGTSFGAHVWWGGDAVLNQHIFRLDRASDSVTREWARTAINHRINVLVSKAHGGVGLRHVTKREVERLSIPLPPIDDQRRITGHLKEQFDQIEMARGAVTAQLEAAKALPAAHLREVFDSPEAQGWPTKTLAETAQLLPSKSIATAGDTEVHAITTACLTEQGFEPAGIKLARMWSSDAVESIVSRGEVLVARSNTAELVGRAATYNGESSGVVASDLTIRIMPQRDVFLSDFLGRYLSYLYLTGFWRERAGGASGSMKKITRTQILRLAVPVPKIEDQERISTRLGSELNGVRSLAAAIAGEGRAVATMQNAILRKVFNGEV